MVPIRPVPLPVKGTGVRSAWIGSGRWGARIRWGTRGLVELRLLPRRPRDCPGVSGVPAPILRAVRNALRGRPFRPPRYDLAGLTRFQRRVLEVLARLPARRLVTYGGLARLSGSPRAARAVGQAVHRNPIPLLIPCHRVVASGMRLGGYGGGISLKAKLLKNEGFGVNFDGMVLYRPPRL